MIILCRQRKRGTEELNETMKINLDKDELGKLLDCRLAQAQKATHDNGRIPGNALNDCDDGKIAALQDAKGVLALCSEEVFSKMLGDVWKQRKSTKKPHYNEVQDKSNADTWWLTGYESVMKMLDL